MALIWGQFRQKAQDLTEVAQDKAVRQMLSRSHVERVRPDLPEWLEVASWGILAAMVGLLALLLVGGVIFWADWLYLRLS